MLGRRLFSALIIISLILCLLRLDFWLGTPEMIGRPGLALVLLALGLAVLAARELVLLWPATAGRPGINVVTGATLAMVVVSCLPVLFTRGSVGSTGLVDTTYQPFVCSLVGLLLAFVMTCCFEMFHYGRTVTSPGTVTDRLARATLVYVYLSMLFGFLIPHRLMEGSNSLGLISVIALIATVKFSDSVAYFVGKSLGTVKLAPKLSPQKTVQGAVGALFGGCAAAAIVVFAVAPAVFNVTIDKPWWWFVVYGLVVTSAGMIGDLAESLLKRDADCKDSSRWLPGLGGVLDVLDSMIFAAPVSYFLWLL